MERDEYRPSGPPDPPNQPELTQSGRGEERDPLSSWEQSEYQQWKRAVARELGLAEESNSDELYAVMDRQTRLAIAQDLALPINPDREDLDGTIIEGVPSWQNIFYRLLHIYESPLTPEQVLKRLRDFIALQDKLDEVIEIRSRLDEEIIG